MYAGVAWWQAQSGVKDLDLLPIRHKNILLPFAAAWSLHATVARELTLPAWSLHAAVAREVTLPACNGLLSVNTFNTFWRILPGTLTAAQTFSLMLSAGICTLSTRAGYCRMPQS